MYRLYDLYDDVDMKYSRIGTYDKWQDLENAARKYVADHAQICDLYYCIKNPETGTYLRIDLEPVPAIWGC